ncbi:MAG TPA: alkaline phosphatase family protein, partial [Vicinamibacterales bacterium]
MRRALTALVCLTVLLCAIARPDGQTAAPRHNVLIFVADGLRHDSVTAQDTPALWSVRAEGVHFENSHAVYPTFTTANASAIASGHGLGDTGDFSNTIWGRFAPFDGGDFDQLPGTPVPFLENDRIVAELDAHFAGNYLGTPTFLEMARAHGYRTAAMGKEGPTAIQDAAAISPVHGAFPASLPGIVIDDATGNGTGLPLSAELRAEMLNAGFPTATPTRSNGYGATSPFNNGYSGDRLHRGTLAADLVQEQWLADAATRFVLPWLTADPS